MTGQKKEVTLRGVIVAQDWDADNCPTEVSLQTPDGREYFVDEIEAGEELLDLEGAEVEITGMIDERDPEYPSLVVSDYEILHDPYDDDEDEEGEEEDWDDDDDGDWDEDEEEEWDEDEEGDFEDEDEEEEDWDEEEEDD